MPSTMRRYGVGKEVDDKIAKYWRTTVAHWFRKEVEACDHVLLGLQFMVCAVALNLA